MKRNLLSLLFIVSFLSGYSQALELIDSINIVKADLLTTDQKGNIYLTDVHGNIYQYSEDLVLKLSYSPPKPFQITKLDTWQGLRIFCFYRDIQEFSILDRFLVTSENYQFVLPSNAFISLATPSFDNNLWLVDQPSMTLFKYNITQRRIEFDIPFNAIIPYPLNNIVLFKEYQNKILVIDAERGLFLFDNLGNYLLTRQMNVGEGLGLFEDYIYYLKDQRLIFKNLYRDDQYNIEIPANRNPTNMIRSNQWVFILEGKMLYKYRIK